jgi:anion-transporting  ArsA/GET3 family ATPase
LPGDDSPPLLARRLLFVTGKGGVGKTTVAAALAQLAVSNGRKVLACEVDAKGALPAAFEAAPVGFEPREVEPGLRLMAMDTEASLREYLRIQLRLPRGTPLGPLASTFDFVADAAPGVKEIVTVGKLAYEVRERHHDLVVVDAPASGHVVAQLAAPRAISELVKVGLIRTQTDWIQAILHDRATTGVVVVCTPEEMPVTETIELVASIRAATSVDVAAIVVNRVLPELFGRAEEDVFERLSAPSTRSRLEAAVGPAVGPVLEGARLAVQLRRSRAAHLDRLRESLPDVPLIYLPMLFARPHGARATRVLADALADELG